jgi:hypothetical protein
MSLFSRRTTLAAVFVLPRFSSRLLGAQAKPRRKRADCFFGIHLDLHPNANDQHLGRDLTAENVAALLDRVQPDFIQYDCKGHAGWLGYRSQVSRSSPGILQDSLALWRKLTAERGVSLYIHFSGVWDSLAIEENPTWARIDANGKADKNQTSLWSPYLEQRMIPQLLEAATKYDLDGVWVDGDCWQTNPDYGPEPRKAWMQFRFGQEPPKQTGDPQWDVWLELNRQRFRNYVKRYADALHAKRPNFEIASNWLYSTFVPEKPELPVDFLSGDYLGNAALPRARLEARYLAQTGKPWDLMAWGFQQANSNPVGSVHKPAAQLQQEAATVLAQGGGFQIYYQPTRAGRIDERHIETMASVAKFARERQSYSHQSESLSQVAVWFSKRSLYQTSGKLFGGWGNLTAPAVGVLEALVAAHWSVDVQPDWAPLRCRTLVVPEWKAIGDRAAEDLVEQARRGLGLVICGVENAKLFGPLLGVRCDPGSSNVSAWIPGDELFANARGDWGVCSHAEATVIAQRFPTYDSTRDGVPAAIRIAIGMGAVVFIPGPVGTLYDNTHAPALKQLMDRCLRSVATPQVELVQSRAPLELALRRKGDATVLHFCNYAGQQVAGNFAVHDFVPPISAQRVRVRLPKAPRSLHWHPSGTALGFEITPTPDGVLLEFTTPEIPIHAMAVMR